MALGQLVGGGAARPQEELAHLVEAGVDEVLGVVDPPLGCEPATACQHCATHDPGRPDVAEEAALVADLVREPRLPEELVELLSMLLGHLVTDLGNLSVDVRGFRPGAFGGHADCAEQRIR